MLCGTPSASFAECRATLSLAKPSLSNPRGVVSFKSEDEVGESASDAMDGSSGIRSTSSTFATSSSPSLEPSPTFSEASTDVVLSSFKTIPTVTYPFFSSTSSLTRTGLAVSGNAVSEEEEEEEDSSEDDSSDDSSDDSLDDSSEDTSYDSSADVSVSDTSVTPPRDSMSPTEPPITRVRPRKSACMFSNASALVIPFPEFMGGTYATSSVSFDFAAATVSLPNAEMRIASSAPTGTRSLSTNSKGKPFGNSCFFFCCPPDGTWGRVRSCRCDSRSSRLRDSRVGRLRDSSTLGDSNSDCRSFVGRSFVTKRGVVGADSFCANLCSGGRAASPIPRSLRRASERDTTSVRRTSVSLALALALANSAASASVAPRMSSLTPARTRPTALPASRVASAAASVALVSSCVKRSPSNPHCAASSFATIWPAAFLFSPPAVTNCPYAPPPDTRSAAAAALSAATAAALVVTAASTRIWSCAAEAEANSAIFFNSLSFKALDDNWVVASSAVVTPVTPELPTVVPASVRTPPGSVVFFSFSTKTFTSVFSNPETTSQSASISKTTSSFFEELFCSKSESDSATNPANSSKLSRWSTLALATSFASIPATAPDSFAALNALVEAFWMFEFSAVNLSFKAEVFASATSCFATTSRVEACTTRAMSNCTLFVASMTVALVLSLTNVATAFAATSTASARATPSLALAFAQRASSRASIKISAEKALDNESRCRRAPHATTGNAATKVHRAVS
mmetsp:Transcript_11655/g.38669  ORF Transcript_11655/g.38669 Transcript_11655/m.38669 type:complete len:743 (-) Transcript_11655:484-2712(-)